jgi:hypothetical protein
MAIRVEQKVLDLHRHAIIGQWNFDPRNCQLNGIPIAEDTDVRILHTKSKDGPYDHFYVGKKIVVRAYLA